MTINLTFIAPDGGERHCDGKVGSTAMLAALMAGIDGILAECGGSLACGTCHVYVDEAHVDRIAPPEDGELAMLETVAAERRPNSRLSCQISLTSACQGLVMKLPDTQL